MTRHGEAIVQQTRAEDTLNSIRAERRGRAAVLLGTSLMLAVSMSVVVLLFGLVLTNQQQIANLKSALTEEQRCKIDPELVCAAPVAPRAEAIAPTKEINTVPIFGSPGKDGRDGTDGKDGATGAEGATGLSGSPGAKGAVGAAGAIGKPGVQGQTGPAGDTGAQGERGERGLPGINGTDGKPGPSGSPGADGKDGVDGKDGADGKTPTIGKHVIDFTQDGQCSVTVYFSDSTSKHIDLCPSHD